MEEKTGVLLTKILTDEELSKIPENVRKKVEKCFEEKFEELLTKKALGEAARNSLDEVREKYEKELEDLKVKLADYEAKLAHSQQNVDELREQLDASRLEVERVLETTKRYEVEAHECRRERNDVVDERDSLLKMMERRNAEIERLQADNRTYETQLQAAINAKCEALAKLDEIQSKEISLEYKEKRMDQEKVILTNQVQSLSQDLNRNIAELQSIRRDNTMRSLELETKLNQKTEELKIANSSIAHLNEMVVSLTTKSEDLSAKLLAQAEESTRMMEFYKKELHAKSKLVELYKGTDEEKNAEHSELENTITELKKMLNEAIDQYGQLETKLKAFESKYEQDMEEKNNAIQALKDELKHANDLLKEAQEENLDNAIEQLAPSAAVTTRLIKSDMSLTELYSLYVKTTEDLHYQKKENAKLNLQMKQILHELEEKAPVIKKQSFDNQKLLAANNELSQQLENLITEKVEGREELQDALSKVNYLERENKKLKIGQNDLGRQVCYLLKEIEQMRGGFTSENEQSISSDMSANEVISKKLVTFNDITELQENNQKLILLVRDLSSKLEEMEEVQTGMDQASYEAKIKSYTKRLQEMQESQEYHTQMMTVCMQQRDRYKKLYYDVMKSSGKNMSGNFENTLNGDQMEGVEDETTQLAPNSSNVVSNEVIAGKDKHIKELEEKIKELTNQIKTIKDEYEEYRKEKHTNERMMNEQFDSMRTEIRELTSTNCKLMSNLEYNNEQISIQQKNAATYKKQISTLEDRSKNYESTIVKHEQTILYLKDEAMNAQHNLARAEVQVENLKQECRLLRDSESRLQLEREVLHREKQTQNLLLNNIEMIKAQFERSETEGRIRMESRLDEATRECSALRRRLQEEQDEFRQLSSHLKRQTETAKERMEEEKAAADKLREELSGLREELVNKSKQIDDLSKKLQESLTPTKNDNPIAQANKKAREFEMKYQEIKLEVESLTKELDTAREHAQQYCKMSQSSEKELKELHDVYSEYKNRAEEELQKLRLSEANLQTRVEELETEVKLQITGSQLADGSSTVQLNKVQEELKEALQKLSVNNHEIKGLKEQCNILRSQLQATETKYANEMIMHSSDIQELSKVKEDLSKTKEKLSGLQLARNKAITALEEFKKGRDKNEEQIKKEREELERRIVDLDAQNASLHDQIQALSTKLSLDNAGGQHHQPQSTDDTMNDSNADQSISNRSISEEESRNNDQLLRIIKYLRKEKDIAIAKVDILKSENVRLLSEHNILQTKLDEFSKVIKEERTKTESVAVTASKHEEILRKVETLNAITDSNRILRSERDTLDLRVREMTETVTRLQDELFPLQEKSRELAAKNEELTLENASLRTEAVKWRQRANVLVERSNKNPEEFKRIKNECESLSKMLQAEKDAHKHTYEELTAKRNEKSRLESQISNLNTQLNNLSEENKKLAEELNKLKQENFKMSYELMELKNQMLLQEENLKKATDDLTAKEEQLIDVKNRELQIRKIAKRYKDSFFELKNKEDKEAENPAESGDSQSAAEPEASTAKQDTEKEYKEKLTELNTQIRSTQEENEKLRKEIEGLKASAQKEEMSKYLLKEAKNRIMNLTEAKNAVARELAATKTQLQNVEQSREEHETIVSGLKGQYEAKICRLEKELSESDKDTKETIARLNRENETLILRISQLHRQLGMQQASKPSTSSGSGIDKSSVEAPRTANVKPMSGPSGQQSATVTPWRGGETPLASIRPMSVQNSRTAAVLPTSQTSSVTAIQGSSSGSVTALVPPQQQVHTTGNSSGEAMSSSPTSSHTDYMPATSSAAVVVAAVPPMGATAESSQEAESVQAQNNESTSSSQIIVSGGQQQQAVALVSPRVEGTQSIVPPQSAQNQDTNQPSTSGTSSSSNVSVSSHHQASSSNTVTTTQAGGHKRPRETEGDSSTCTAEESTEKSQPQNKRTRMQAGEAACQGVSESGLDVEYQVPTSSQRDQEDDIIIVDSEEDDGMADEGNAEVDDGPMEDEADNGDAYEIEESYEQEQDIDEGEGPDIDEDNVQSDNNEVEVDDSSEVPNQSGTASSNNQVAPDAGTSQVVGQSNGDQVTENQNQESQQIQTISSGSEAGSCSQSVSQTSSWRQATPLTRQQQATLLMLQQGFEETGDDSIVPSTPTLYVPRRADGEAISSPHPHVPHAARFTFSESARPGIATGEGMDDTRIDLSEEASGRSVPSTPQQTSPRRDSSATVGEGSSLTEKNDQAAGEVQEPVAGPSHVEGTVPEITVTTAAEDADATGETASQSEVQDGEQSQMEEGDIEEGEGLDGVTSEGEKASTVADESVEIEEGREAEASTSPSINTRSRNMRNAPQNRRGRGGHQRRPTPIIWEQQQQQHARGGGAGNRNINQNVRAANEAGSPSRGGAFQAQRGQRARRMRRPSGPNYGGNLRY